MRFGDYLLKKGMIDDDDLKKVARQQEKASKPLGRLAVEQNILSREDILQIRTLQRKMKGRFGTVAVDLNLLSPSQVESLMELQNRRRPLIGELMVQNDLLTAVELLDELKSFREAHPKESLARYRVVLLDLDNRTRYHMQNEFSRNGYDVTSLPFSPNALKIIENDRPDCVVVSLLRNKKEIFEACAECQARGGEPLTVLALVDRLDPDDRATAQSAGIAEFTPVTAPAEKVVAYVNTLLENLSRKLVRKVMIVDDSPTVLRFTSQNLDNAGYDTYPAASGEKAIEMLERVTPDLILSDLQMPGMNGLEFCRQIKANPLWHNIPLLMVTTTADPEMIRESLDAGAADYIVKPFQTEELLARVRAHIRTKRLFDEIQKSKRDLMVANEKLTESNRKKTEFLATVAHDLKTPLTSIRTFSNLLKLCGDKPKEQAEFQEIIESEIIRMTALINNYLDLSRLESGEATYKTDEVDLVGLLRYMARLYGRMAKHKHIRFDIDLPELPLHLAGDADRLQQVFSNLLDNAIKFTPREGTIKLHLRATGKTGKKYAEATVTDSGKGVPKEARDYLFKRFHQVPNPNQAIEGTGLGLAICRDIVERHGGKVELKKTEGKGATFRVVLPLSQS